MRNTVVFWAEKLTERWYLLVLFFCFFLVFHDIPGLGKFGFLYSFFYLDANLQISILLMTFLGWLFEVRLVNWLMILLFETAFLYSLQKQPSQRLLGELRYFGHFWLKLYLTLSLRASHSDWCFQIIKLLKPQCFCYPTKYVLSFWLDFKILHYVRDILYYLQDGFVKVIVYLQINL